MEKKNGRSDMLFCELNQLLGMFGLTNHDEQRKS